MATERAEDFRRAIEGATSLEDLQERIARLQGPGLKLTETEGQTLPMLKKVLSERLQESVKDSTAIISSPWNPNLWAIIQRTVRIFILTVVYGLAFAAGSQRRECDFSLLREGQMRWDRLWVRRAERRRERLETREQRLLQREQEALEARVREIRQDPPEDRETAAPRVQPPRGLPVDMDYFHQLSVDGDEEVEEK